MTRHALLTTRARAEDRADGRRTAATGGAETPADGDAPSGGWRSVYASMGVSTSAEERAVVQTRAATPRRRSGDRRSDDVD